MNIYVRIIEPHSCFWILVILWLGFIADGFTELWTWCVYMYLLFLADERYWKLW